MPRRPPSQLLVIFLLAFVVSCTKSGSIPGIASQGNGQGYGGGDLAWVALNNARINLARAFRKLADSTQLNLLGNSQNCETTLHPLICPALTGVDGTTRAFVQETRAQYLSFLEKDPHDLFELSPFALSLHGREVNAMTEIGPEGKIQIYRDGVLAMTPLDVMLVVVHEIGHKVDQNGYKNDSEDEDFLNEVGAALAWYTHSRTSAWDEIDCAEGKNCIRDFNGMTSSTNLGTGDFRIAFSLLTTQTLPPFSSSIFLMNKASVCNFDNKHVDIRIINGKIYASFNINDAPGTTPKWGVNLANFTSTSLVNDGITHQVVIERKNRDYRLYIDGKLEFSKVASTDLDVQVGTGWRLGDSVCQNGNHVALQGFIRFLFYEY